MEKKKYKTSKPMGIVISVLAITFLICLPAGIWIDEFRWKLISTSIFALILTFTLTAVEIRKEKEFDEKIQEKKLNDKFKKMGKTHKKC